MRSFSFFQGVRWSGEEDKQAQDGSRDDVVETSNKGAWRRRYPRLRCCALKPYVVVIHDEIIPSLVNPLLFKEL